MFRFHARKLMRMLMADFSNCAAVADLSAKLIAKPAPEPVAVVDVQPRRGDCKPSRPRPEQANVDSFKV
jgi:hypothetical protein